MRTSAELPFGTVRTVNHFRTVRHSIVRLEDTQNHRINPMIGDIDVPPFVLNSIVHTSLSTVTLCLEIESSDRACAEVTLTRANEDGISVVAEVIG